MTKTLDIYLHQNRAAQVTQNGSDALSLQYLPEYIQAGGAALSIALPVRTQPYTNKPTKIFLEGLVPESESARERLAQEHSISARNAFALLKHIGLDCAGAIQLIPEGQHLPKKSSRAEVPAAEIAHRIVQARSALQSSWVLPNESWSLGGAQAKFALTQLNGKWFHTQGALPSTHIFKPGIPNLNYQALNEHLCLQAASALGLLTASTRIMEFGKEQAIVVERYDRALNGDRILRVHQEDLCQAMGYLPSKKYESQGGPSASAIIQFLRRTATPEIAQNNIDRFVQALMFNCLIGAPDAHAKNYSLIYLDGHTPILAPLYDIASALAYTDSPESGAVPEGQHAVADIRKSAMKVGGEAVFSQITGERWRKFAKDNKLNEQQVMDWLESYCLAIPQAFDIVCAQQTATGMDELKAKLLNPIKQLCAQIYQTM